MSGTLMVSTSEVRAALLMLRTTMADAARPADILPDWLESPAYVELDALLMAVSRGAGPDQMLLSDALSGVHGLRRLDVTACGDRGCAYRSGLAGPFYTAIADSAGYISASARYRSGGES